MLCTPCCTVSSAPWLLTPLSRPAVRFQVKQSKCRSGCADLDAEQLQAKEQEAARAAAELLEQLEREEAERSAKAAKKKKKGAPG